MTGPEFTESVSNEIRQSIAIARERAEIADAIRGSVLCQRLGKQHGVPLYQSDRPLKNYEAGGAQTGMSGPPYQHDTPGEARSVLVALERMRK